jgi:hypothetical protein
MEHFNAAILFLISYVNYHHQVTFFIFSIHLLTCVQDQIIFRQRKFSDGSSTTYCQFIDNRTVMFRQFFVNYPPGDCIFKLKHVVE